MLRRTDPLTFQNGYFLLSCLKPEAIFLLYLLWKSVELLKLNLPIFGGLTMTCSPWSIFLSFVHTKSSAFFHFHFTLFYFLHWFSQSFPLMSHCSGKPHIPLCACLSLQSLGQPFSPGPLLLYKLKRVVYISVCQCFIYFKTEWQLLSFLHIKQEIGSPTHI